MLRPRPWTASNRPERLHQPACIRTRCVSTSLGPGTNGQIQERVSGIK